MKAVYFNLLIMLCTAMLTAHAAPAPVPQYEVAGFIQLTDNKGKTTPFCDFQVAVSGKCSLIHVTYFNGESFACGTDGIDSYLLNEMVPATRQNGAGTYQFADITAGAFPRKALTPIQAVWLSFASGGNLNSDEGQLPLEGFQDLASFTRPEVALATAAPRLPRSIKWWGPNFYIIGSEKEHRSLPGYPHGYLAGVYTVGTTTNFSGFELPLNWKLACYLPDANKQVARREEVTLSQTLTATVTNLSALAYHGDFLPALGTQPVQFVEHRLKADTGPGTQYPVVNGVPLTHWPRRSDPAFRSLARNLSPGWNLWWTLTRSKYKWPLAVAVAAILLTTFSALKWWGSGQGKQTAEHRQKL